MGELSALGRDSRILACVLPSPTTFSSEVRSAAKLEPRYSLL